MCTFCHSSVWVLRSFIEAHCDRFQVEITPDLTKESDEVIDALLGAICDWIITSRNAGIENYSLWDALEKSKITPPNFIISHGKEN